MCQFQIKKKIKFYNKFIKRQLRKTRGENEKLLIRNNFLECQNDPKGEDFDKKLINLVEENKKVNKMLGEKRKENENLKLKLSKIEYDNDDKEDEKMRLERLKKGHQMKKKQWEVRLID